MYNMLVMPLKTFFNKTWGKRYNEKKWENWKINKTQSIIQLSVPPGYTILGGVEMYLCQSWGIQMTGSLASSDWLGLALQPVGWLVDWVFFWWTGWWDFQLIELCVLEIFLTLNTVLQLSLTNVLLQNLI